MPSYTIEFDLDQIESTAQEGFIALNLETSGRLTAGMRHRGGHGSKLNRLCALRFGQSLRISGYNAILRRL